MKCKMLVPLVILCVATPAFAGWQLTSFDLKFKNIAAHNGMLLGIEERTNYPYKWQKPSWEKLGNEEFVSLATDGLNIVGIKRSNQNAYIFDRTSWKKIGSQLNKTFAQLVFGQQKLIGRGPDPYGFTFVWDKSGWNDFGAQKMWSIDAVGPIICGIQQSYVKNALNNLACMWQKKDWQKLSWQQFKQIATNGSQIFAIGLPQKKPFAFRWNGKTWDKLGKEKFVQIATDKNILCGIQEKTGLILRWTGKKWIALDTKKFTQVVTDGTTIYGLANNKKVYFWTNR